MAGEWKEKKVVESGETGILGIKVSGDSVAFKESDRDKAIIASWMVGDEARRHRRDHVGEAD